MTDTSCTTTNNGAHDFATKRELAARYRFSVRHIDNLIAKGMPHMKIGARRVRINITQADAWMQEQFGTRRLK